MRRIMLQLLFGAFLVLHGGQVAKADWMDDLNRVQADIQRMNQQIQQNVNAQLANVHAQIEQTNVNVADVIKNAQAQAAKAQTDAFEAFNNMPKDAISQVTNVGPNGQSIIISGRSGTAKSVHSGTDSNGHPYFVESENLVVGDTLFHTDRIYNTTTKQIDESRYTLDLKDPQAKPVYTKVAANPLM